MPTLTLSCAPKRLDSKITPGLGYQVLISWDGELLYHHHKNKTLYITKEEKYRKLAWVIRELKY